MRLPLAILAALAAMPAFGQDKVASPPTANRCAPIASKLGQIEPFSTPRLFIRYDQDWQEITPSLFGPDFTLDKYSGGRINFLYVVPPSDVRLRQFLSVRSVADTIEPDNFVNLRRQHDHFDAVYSGTYEGYHANGDTSAMLRRFHRWPGGDRSDDPKSSRESWSFQTKQELARRRVLSIPFRAGDQPICVPFVIGPNIATPVDEADGEDDITVLKGFIVEITEAKAATGSSGRTFKVRSPVTKVP